MVASCVIFIVHFWRWVHGALNVDEVIMNKDNKYNKDNAVALSESSKKVEVLTDIECLIETARWEINRYYTCYEDSFKKFGYELEDYTQDILLIVTRAGWDNALKQKDTFVRYIRSLCFGMYYRRIRQKYCKVQFDKSVEMNPELAEGGITPADVSIEELYNKIVDRLPTYPVFRGMSYRDIFINYVKTGCWTKSTKTLNNAINVRFRQELIFLTREALA